MKAFIGDGYDRTFYIKGEPWSHENVRIRGRMMAGFQSTALVKEGNATDGIDAEMQIYAERIAARITGWQYQDDKGQWKKFDDQNGDPLPINAKSLGGLAPKLFWRIRDIIMGSEPSDVDPDSGEQVKTDGDDEKN